MGEDARKRVLWEALQDAAGAVAAFKTKFGHEPSEAERTIALSLFIDAQKALAPKKPWQRSSNGGQQQGPPVAGKPDVCIECQGTEFYDNRAQKAAGEYKATSPDFKCKRCRHGYWLNPPKRAAAPAEASGPEPGADDAPW